MGDTASTIQAARKPNLIIILADDLGYGDLRCYGNTRHHTPHIDALAAAGVRFSDFYMTSPVCTPSRVALLTGRHPARVGFSTLLWPTTEGGMPQSERSLARILRPHGYVSGLAGKWHLGHSHKQYLPLAHDFDSYYGMPYPNDMGPDHPQAAARNEQWPPMPMMRGDDLVEAPIDVNLLTQQYTAEAIRFIAENHHRPFFLFMSHSMPHTIIGASPAFRGKSRNGLYGDAVQELDWSVGELTRTLRTFGLENDTMIVFSSDNGAVLREQYGGDDEKARQMFPDLTFGTNFPLRGGKQSTYEGGVRVPGFITWPGRITPGRLSSTLAWVADVVPTFLDYAGLPLHDDRKYDGLSLRPLLDANAPLPTRPLAFGSSSILGLRAGDWKLVMPQQPRFIQTDSDKPMLYNVGEDIGERRNLASEYPELLVELLAQRASIEADMLADRVSR